MLLNFPGQIRVHDLVVSLGRTREMLSVRYLFDGPEPARRSRGVTVLTLLTQNWHPRTLIDYLAGSSKSIKLLQALQKKNITIFKIFLLLQLTIETNGKSDDETYNRKLGKV